MLHKKGPPPYGFQRSSDGLVVPCKTEQAVLRDMKHLRDIGYSYGKIANTINRSGRFPRSGKVWVRHNVMRLFTNKRFSAIGEPIIGDTGGLEYVDPAEPNEMQHKEVVIENISIEPSWSERLIEILNKIERHR